MIRKAGWKILAAVQHSAVNIKTAAADSFPVLEQ